MFKFRKKKSKNNEKNLNTHNENNFENVQNDQSSKRYDQNQQYNNDESNNGAVQQGDTENIEQNVDDFQNQNQVYEKVIYPSFANNNNMTYSHEELVDRNLFLDTLYTETDLENFNLSLDEVVKVFKNGSVYFKLKEPMNQSRKSKDIFKKNTKFSLSKFDNETMETDVFFEDFAHVKGFDIDSLLTFDDGIKPELKNEIYELNKKLEAQIEHIQSYKFEESQLDKIMETHKDILNNQMELKQKIMNLKDDYANSNIFYKVRNISFNTWNEDDIYFGYKLNDISFDIYATDRIVILSDDCITNQLLIDVLRGDETKSSGYIYKNLHREQKWMDIDDTNFNQYKVQSMDLYEEVYYSLASPDYLSFNIHKKDSVALCFNKIFSSLSVSVDENFKNKLLNLMKFDDNLKTNIFQLDDLNLEKFVTICDILIGKKIILMKSICQGMSYSEKTSLFRFLNSYFDSKKITVIYASDDYLEANLLATKIMTIKKGGLIEIKNIDNILKYFNSINDYILYTLKYGTSVEKEINSENDK